jgi:outer membrane protein OmpA-like peptidoglycan-associated protein
VLCSEIKLLTKSLQMKIKILLFTFLLTFFHSFSENTKEFNTKFDKAQEELSVKNYYLALPLFIELLDIDRENANLNYLVGICYAEQRYNRANSIPYLEKAVLSTSKDYKSQSNTERNAPTIAFKKLGEEYHSNTKLDLAIESFEKYKSQMTLNNEKDEKNLKETDRFIAMCRTAKTFVANPVKVKIENLGPNVNSIYSDYSPVLSADQETMIFTSRRTQGVGGKIYETGKYYEDIYISQKTKKGWSVAENIGTNINTNANEASVGISPDGQEILIYKDDNGDGNIYSTKLDGDVWSKPIKLNSNINTKSWEPSAFISADGQSIYFVSDRSGGFGGRDIYKSIKDEKGEWGKAENLGATVNTEFEEDAPFIHPDGVTLFFSSNGHNTMGGFDIFYTTISDDGVMWNTPVNVGYPVNSTNDDVFYVVSPDKTKAYYSSFKEGGLGEKDNFMITFPDQTQAPLVVVKGKIVDSNNMVPKGVEITVTNNETGKVLGVYRPNKSTGNYLFVLVPGNNYNISYEADGFMFYSENRIVAKKTNFYETYRNIQLPPIMIGSRMVLNNIFFDFDKSNLRNTSNVELRNIVRFLKKYPKINVEIDGYTDSKGTPEYNMTLSVERANAVINYITTNGIEKSRLSAKGFGESKPDASNQTLDGEDNPEGRQLNRRVEMKIVEIK